MMKLSLMLLRGKARIMLASSQILSAISIESNKITPLFPPPFEK